MAARNPPTADVLPQDQPIPPEPHQQPAGPTGGRPPRNPRGYPQETTYVAVDGIVPSDLTTEEAERLEVKVAEFVIKELDRTPDDVRVVRGGKGVIEFEYE